MKVQTVTYSRLVSGPGYSNTTIGATAILDGDEAPENALSELEGWVGRQFELRRKVQDDLDDAERQLWPLKSELSGLQEKIAAATQRWETVKAVSAALGVDLTQRLGNEINLADIPF